MFNNQSSLNKLYDAYYRYIVFVKINQYNALDNEQEKQKNKFKNISTIFWRISVDLKLNLTKQFLIKTPTDLYPGDNIFIK